MAKKKPLSPEQIEEAKNLARIEQYVAFQSAIYDDLIEELAKMASLVVSKVNPKQVFAFSNFPALRDKVTKLVQQTSIKSFNSLSGGIMDGIDRSNHKNDLLVDKVFKSTSIPKEDLKKYYIRNLEAAGTRATKSQLSSRVYRLTKQYQQVVESGVDIGIASGKKSARELASEIRKAVKDPEFAFRRVRNDKGNLEWSKAAKAYAKENPPGQGVYLSPQKNYERLTRTEINMAYRTTDFEREKAMDFIVGKRINLSTNPNHCPTCIALQGVYPKNFLFRGWHPQCRCYVTTILKTREEMDRDNLRILRDKEPLAGSVNTVKKTPKGFDNWLKENKTRLERAKARGTLPYFIQDNINSDWKTVPGQIIGGVAK